MPKPRNAEGPYWQTMDAVERRLLTDTLVATGGDIQRAADLLDVSRNFIRGRIGKLMIDVDAIRGRKVGGTFPRPSDDDAPAKPRTSWLTGDS